MIYHKGATQLDQCAHRLMEFNLSPDWHGSTVVGDYIAYYHEEKLYTVRHLKKGVSCLVYARSPYDAIEKVRAMEDPVPPHGEWYGEADGYINGELVYDMWSCGCCGKYFPEWDEKPDWNYCPNCGADMRAEEGET